ncbi:MAG: alpha-2-macroglobulin family protein, partial [Raineya sp.]
PFVAATSKAKLVLSTSPLAEFSENLDYLLQYPYGCVEQTISTAFPQLYVTELSRQLKAKNADYKGTNTGESRYNVQQAILKLYTMQMYNGALSYWQGSDQETWWGTAYAAHFLYEAQKAGYNVSEPFLERIAQYLEKKVKEKATERYYFYGEQNERFSKTIISKEVPYTLYVLALMRRGDIATMNYCKANQNLLALDSKYLLAATYLMMGDKTSYNAILPKKFVGERSENAFSGSFYSYIRDEAIALNALLETDKQNPQIPIMSKHLSEQIRSKKYLNTQESAFALLALGKIAKQAQTSQTKAGIKAEGKEIAKFEKDDLVLTENILGKTLQISATGAGVLYYFWEMQGVPANPKIKEEDSFLKVRRSFYNRAGQELKNAEFTQNDLIVVKISVQSTDGSNVGNVAVTDLLPAGLEIENTRLLQTAMLPWVKDASTPDYIDIRDDKISIFCEADGNVKNYYYLVRAVSVGEFQMGAVAAEAMYASEYHSYFGARKVTIKQKSIKTQNL